MRGSSAKRRAKSVLSVQREDWSVESLIGWVNQEMQCEISSLRELKTGAIYCQLVHRLYPHAVDLERVNWVSRFQADFEENFELLETAFRILNVNCRIVKRELIKGRGHFELVSWMRQFYSRNNRGKAYNPVFERGGKSIGLTKTLAQRRSVVQRSASLEPMQSSWNSKDWQKRSHSSDRLQQNQSPFLNIGPKRSVFASSIELDKLFEQLKLDTSSKSFLDTLATQVHVETNLQPEPASPLVSRIFGNLKLNTNTQLSFNSASTASSFPKVGIQTNTFEGAQCQMGGDLVVAQGAKPGEKKPNPDAIPFNQADNINKKNCAKRQRIKNDFDFSIPKEINQESIKEINQKLIREIDQNMPMDSKKDSFKELKKDVTKEINQSTQPNQFAHIDAIPFNQADNINKKNCAKRQKIKNDFDFSIPKEINQESIKEINQKLIREIDQNMPMDSKKDSFKALKKDVTKEINQSTPKEKKKDIFRQLMKDFTKETNTNVPKETKKADRDETPSDIESGKAHVKVVNEKATKIVALRNVNAEMHSIIFKIYQMAFVMDTDPAEIRRKINEVFQTEEVRKYIS